MFNQVLGGGGSSLPLHPLTQVEESVEQHYRDTTRYLSDECRYQVRLPRSSTVAALGESKGQALQRYYTNEKSIIS